jgi:hypothetical protein
MKIVVILLCLGVAQCSYAWDTSLANCDEALRAKGLCGSSSLFAPKAPKAVPTPPPIKAEVVAPVAAPQQPATPQPNYQYSPVEIQNPDPYVQTLIKSRNRTMSDPEFGTHPALLTHVERIDAQILSYVAKYHQK